MQARSARFPFCATNLFAVSLSAVLLIAICSSAFGQEAYLVATDDSSLTAFNLGTDQQILQAASPFRGWSVKVGANPRLAFVICNNFYVSVIDLTLQREVKRIYDVWGTVAGMTADGRNLLVSDDARRRFEVIDTSSLQLVYRLDLRVALGTNYTSGSIKMIGNKAYMAPSVTDPNRPAMAVIDKTTGQVKAIPIPAGQLLVNPDSPNLAVTPDEKYLVMLEDETSDGSSHLIFIDPVSDQVVMDHKLANIDAGMLLISPKGTDPTKSYGYLIGSGSTEVVDLRPASPNFGLEIPGTLGSTPQGFFSLCEGAINSDGSRIVITGFRTNPNSPQANVALFDTAKMLTDPAHQLVSTHVVGNGARARGATFAKITTTPPNSAPTVTKVQGTVVNNAASEITITGTNFRDGALVRIGKMAPIPASVDNSTTLRVTVPVNAPANNGLDIVVTDPDTGNSADQQYQSGLLAAQFNIGLNPAFQPGYQFASLGRLGGGAVSLFNMRTRTMNVVSTNGLIPSGLAFNAADGNELYVTTPGPVYSIQRKALQINIAADSVDASIPFTGNLAQYVPIARSVNPATGDPVMFVPRTFSTNNIWNLELEMIDANPQSPTYNKVVVSIGAPLGYNAAPNLTAVAPTPDGKYVYVFFGSQSPQNGTLGHLAQFDIVNKLSGVDDLSTNTPIVAEYAQVQIGMSQDGKTAVVNGYANRNQTESMLLYDIGSQQGGFLAQVRQPLLPNLGNARLYSYQVLGNRLYAFDWRGYVLAFNFDVMHKDFRFLAMYRLPGHSDGQGSTVLAVSPDGQYLYVPVRGDDAIAVLDPNLLASGKMPLVTEIANQPNIFAVAVSPVPPPLKPRLSQRKNLASPTAPASQKSQAAPGNNSGKAGPAAQRSRGVRSEL